MKRSLVLGCGGNLLEGARQRTFRFPPTSLFMVILFWAEIGPAASGLQKSIADIRSVWIEVSN
ncbi:hypothetical protein MES4922_30093 [Mesorhizobium ventifaucium]|uniref:Uncharacterized protein n=1 Tax=Mesorhizobium ventifaucium TaxID=666020 RepID=A0ABM9DXE9_9HYPH|nr:hypothetical protein MES4922_30093 [Mesorhizobium ventifaucium]